MPAAVVKPDSRFWQAPVPALLVQLAASNDGLGSTEAARRLVQLARALGVSTDSLLLGTTHEGFCDKHLNEIFKDFSALPLGDRKIIVEMIKFLKHHPNE